MLTSEVDCFTLGPSACVRISILGNRLTVSGANEILGVSGGVRMQLISSSSSGTEMVMMTGALRLWQ
jgi:hypothetical protein